MKKFYTLIFILFCCVSTQAVAATKVSDLTDAGTLVGTEKTIVSKSGDTSQSYSTTIDAIKTFLFGSTGQTGLDNSFKNGTATAVAPITAQCDGAGDESALSAAGSTAQTRKSSILVGNGCYMNNQWKPSSGKVTSIFGWAGGGGDVNTIGTEPPRLLFDSANIRDNAPNKIAIDINAAKQFVAHDLYIAGTDNGPGSLSSIFGNTSQNGSCCATNQLHLDNMSLTQSYTLMGCPIDWSTGTCLTGTRTMGGVLMLPRFQKSQFSNFNTAFANNFSDFQLYNSEITGGYVGLYPVYGGGDNMVGQNRFEFINVPVWLGGPENTGFSENSWFNSNTFTQNNTVDVLIEKTNKFLFDGNVFDGTNLYLVSQNGYFQADASWTKGTGWSINTSTQKAEASSATSDLSQRVPTLKGYTYTVNYILTVTGGSVTPYIGGTAGTTRTTSGTYSETIVAGSTMGVKFTGSGFTGTLDNVEVTPTQRPHIAIGGSTGTAANLWFSDNLISGNSNMKYGMDLLGTSDDYLYFSGLVKGANMTHCVNLTNETPAHMVIDCLGQGAGTFTGVYASRGRPFGIGTLTPRSTVALDLNGTDNASKPLGLPQGTTAQRPTCDSNMVGGIRYNTTTGQAETCGANGWQIGSASASTAYSIGNSGTAFTINLANGLSQYVTLTGNATITMPTVVAGGGFDITLLTGAGGFTPTFTGVQWTNGTVPTFTATASRVDRVDCLPNYNLTAWQCVLNPDFR